MSLFRKSKSKHDPHQEYQCTVRFLDDSEPIQVSFKKDTQGQFVLDKVCSTLNLMEKDYFGLRFVDADKQRHWLDPTKTIYKQLKDYRVTVAHNETLQSIVVANFGVYPNKLDPGVSPCVLCFRVKYYPAEPMKLHEEITRYYLFLQLRRDLHHGRLLCSPQDANLLAAYIIQSEVGDYDPQDHPPGYVSEFRMLPKQNIKMEEEIQILHKTVSGQVPAEAEGNFLKKASTLDTYGVDPHQVKDQKDTPLYLGVTHQGIMTFHGIRRTQMYKWNQIKKLAFEGKTFIAHININEDTTQKNAKKKYQPIGYKCNTVAACKYLWKCAVEQQFFFTLQNSFNPPKMRSGGTLFSRGSKFRFSGRCQNEAYSASEDIKRKEPDFQRTCSLPNFVRKTDMKIGRGNSANVSLPITEAPPLSSLPASSTISKVTVEPQKPPRLDRSDPEYKRRDSGNFRKQHTQEIIPKLTDLVSKSPTNKETEFGIAKETEFGVHTSPKVEEARTEVKVIKTIVVTDNQGRQLHKENAIDVGTAEVPQSPRIQVPVQEEIQGVHVTTVSSEPPKLNGRIPIIVTPASDTDDNNATYEPEQSLVENDDVENVAKSLEEQVIELEREYDKNQETNHVGNTLEDMVTPTKSGTVESSNVVTTDVNKSVAKNVAKKSNSCCKVLVYTFFFVSLTLTVAMCVIMFADIEHPIMSQVRSHLSFFEPTRDYIQDKYREVFHKS